MITINNNFNFDIQKILKWFEKIFKSDFFLSPNEERSFISSSPQGDGTSQIQIEVHGLVTNHTDEKLHLLKVDLLKPELGEVTANYIWIKNPETREYGSSHNSGHFIPGRETLPFHIHIMLLVKGEFQSNNASIPVVLSVESNTGKKAKFKVKLKNEAK